LLLLLKLFEMVLS